jgi:hypothetical protein
MNVERWDTCEFSFTTDTNYDNPFTEVDVTTVFTHEGGRTLQVNGFYDGDQTWRVRFMPVEEGDWTFETASNDAALNGQTGKLTGVPPTKDYLKGPISAKGHHFFHADGTPRFLLSTRLSCHFSGPKVWSNAIRYLIDHCINRVFFIMSGVHGTVE